MKPCTYLLAAAALASLTTETKGFVVPSRRPSPVRTQPSDSVVDGNRRSYTHRSRALHESLHATDVTGAPESALSTESSEPPFNVARHALDPALLSELNDPEVARAVMRRERKDTENETQIKMVPPLNVARHALDPALLSELNDPEVARAVMCRERTDTEDAPQIKLVPHYIGKTVNPTTTFWSTLADLPVAFLTFEQSAHSCALTFWQQFIISD